MALDYKFINNVDPGVKTEIQRRESLYWPEGHINKEALSWNYQKTAYILLSAFDPDTKQKVGTISIPTAPILGMYNLNNGVINGAVLNSAEITTDGTNGTYGAVSRITVNFTVFDRYQLDTYIDKFLRPGQDIEIEYGWTVNENINQNKGSLKGTVYNFSFSAKEDGSWNCTLHGMGASAMTYGWNIDQNSTLETNGTFSTIPKDFGFLDIFQSITDKADFLYDIYAIPIEGTEFAKVTNLEDVYNAGYPTKVVENQDYKDIEFYIYNLPVSKEATLGTQIMNVFSYLYYGLTSTEGEVVESKVPYITLQNFIKVVNLLLKKFITNKIAPLYTLDSCYGNGYSENFLLTGPADFSKFAFTTQINGQEAPRFNFKLYDISAGANIDLSKLILINCVFLSNELNSVLGNRKNIDNKKVVTFLNNIFQQLETDTGGIISLQMSDGQKDLLSNQVKEIQILNQNGIPPQVEDNINKLMLKAFTKGSIVRDLSIESKVPDAIQTEVATYTRTPSTYVGSAESKVEEAQKELTTSIEKLKTLNETFMTNIQTDESKQQTSLQQWAAEVRGTYRKIYTLQQNYTLGGSGQKLSQYNIFNMKTAIYPITLKITMDGIEGFKYGNSITTNWLPKQYLEKQVYWTVIKIRHRIENNDWITELETIYRVMS